MLAPAITHLAKSRSPAGYELQDESGTAQMDYPPLELLARIFMSAADAAEADDHDQALLAALAAFSPKRTHPPEPCWKIPGWYEHAFRLIPADQATFTPSSPSPKATGKSRGMANAMLTGIPGPAISSCCPASPGRTSR